MSKKITVAILIFVFLICAGSASGFVTHKDPHGFSLECPEGWGVPSGSNYYWKEGDVIIGTEIYERPTIDSRLLRDLDELIKD